MICANFLAGATLETDDSVRGHESSASIGRSAATYCAVGPYRKSDMSDAVFHERPRVRAVFEAAERNLGAR